MTLPRTTSLVVILLTALFFNHTTKAQIEHGGTPYSSQVDDLSQNVPTVTLAPVDVESTLKEDADAKRAGEVLPFRYGVPVDVSIGLTNAGEWDELPDGSRIWRSRIVSP